MKKSRYQEEQIIAVLKEVDAGAKLRDVVRRTCGAGSTGIRRPIPELTSSSSRQLGVDTCWPSPELATDSQARAHSPRLPRSPGVATYTP